MSAGGRCCAAGGTGMDPAGRRLEDDAIPVSNAGRHGTRCRASSRVGPLGPEPAGYLPFPGSAGAGFGSAARDRQDLSMSKGPVTPSGAFRRTTRTARNEEYTMADSERRGTDDPIRVFLL